MIIDLWEDVMRLGLISIFALTFLIGTYLSPALAQGTISATLADDLWDGEAVPSGHVCQRFGGKGPSPKIKVTGIPSGTTVLIVEFSDESNSSMNNGGHGIVGVEVPKGATSMTIPAIPGETDKLPAGVISYEKHQGGNWSGTGGAYLPPCSGGRSNTYSVKIYGSIGATKKYTNIVKVPLGVY